MYIVIRLFDCMTRTISENYFTANKSRVGPQFQSPHDNLIQCARCLLAFANFFSFRSFDKISNRATKSTMNLVCCVLLLESGTSYRSFFFTQIAQKNTEERNITCKMKYNQIVPKLVRST